MILTRKTSCALLLVAAFGCSRAPEPSRSPLPRDSAVTASKSPGNLRATQLALGQDHSCALFSDGTVRCWGLGADGRLGMGGTDTIGDDEPAGSAPAVDLGGKAIALVAGDAHTCALLDTGRVRCWGRGADGQLGYGNKDSVGDDERPTSAGDVPLTEQATAISAGDNTTCALLASDKVRCWGDNNQGRLGIRGRGGDVGDDEPIESVPSFAFSRPVTQISSDAGSTCVLFADGKVHCWGIVFGSFDDPAVAEHGDDVDVGVPVARLSMTSAAMAGCVITTSGHARCWGVSADLGYAEEDDVGVHLDVKESTPAQVGDLPISGKVVSVLVADEHGCALVEPGEVKCWGSRSHGLLGTPQGEPVATKDAVVVDLGRKAVALAISGWHSCVITDEGRVRCWGFGKDGRLGYGSTENVGDKGPPRDAGDVPLGQ